MYFGGLFGYDAAERRRRAGRLLDEVGIGGERRLQLRKFSKGMLQRVGIAQALINDPELVIFDEPMSGLDPLGRRDVRALILRLRDRGCTVFFSSHVLSDAEALCSRVAILANGRLVASGAADRDAGRSRPAAGSWSSPASPTRQRRRLGAGIRRVVPIGEGRYTLELPLDPPPERLLAELAAAGATLVSLNPLRQTLEDFFVEQVTVARRRWRPRRGRGAAVDEGHRRDRRQRLPRIGPRQGALQPRAVRDPADGRVVPDRPAHGRPGREDHQGPRAGGDVGVRAVHRRVHRHRPGVEGSRAAQHLQPAREADSPLSARPRQVRGPRADAGRQPRRHGARASTRCCCTWRGASIRRSQRAWDAPALDPALLKAIGLIFVELLLVDRHRAVLLDVLDADPVGGA